METILSPSEQELTQLKLQIEESKRKAEYEKLKQELNDITYKASNTPTEFEGVMRIPDTEKVLRAKHNKHHFFDLLFDRIRGMFSLRPIIGNIIALGISILALYYIFTELQQAGLVKYQSYAAIGMQIFAAIQIIKSGTRSLLLPFLALVVGTTVMHSLHHGQTLFHFNKTFYEHLMIVGIIGLGVSVLSID